jgi:hypothetical protein
LLERVEEVSDAVAFTVDLTREDEFELLRRIDAETDSWQNDSTKLLVDDRRGNCLLLERHRDGRIDSGPPGAELFQMIE